MSTSHNPHMAAADEPFERPASIDAIRWAAMSPATRRAMAKLERTRGAMHTVMERGRRPDGRRAGALAAVTGTLADFLGARSARRGDPLPAWLGGEAPPARAHAFADGAAAAAAGGSREATIDFDPRALWHEFLDRTHRQGMPQAAMSTLQGWWDRQPWRDTVEGYAQAFREQGVGAQVAPLVRRHPLAAMVVGMATGAVIVAARPWRASSRMARYVNQHARPWRERGMLLAKGWAVNELRKPAVQAMVAAAVAGLFGPSRAAAARAAQAAGGYDPRPEDGPRRSTSDFVEPDRLRGAADAGYDRARASADARAAS